MLRRFSRVDVADAFIIAACNPFAEAIQGGEYPGDEIVNSADDVIMLIDIAGAQAGWRYAILT